jgi:hypothetical protein
MSKLPTFFCMRTLLSFGGQDLNRVTLSGPHDWQFVLYKMYEPRDSGANQRCDKLAAELTRLWEAKNDRDRC